MRGRQTTGRGRPVGAHARFRVAAKSNSGRIEQQRKDENEPSEDRLVAGADQRREVTHRAKVALDGAALVIRLLKRRPLREGRLCGRPRPERPS